MSDKEKKAVENVVRGRQPVLVPLPVRLTLTSLISANNTDIYHQTMTNVKINCLRWS